MADPHHNDSYEDTGDIESGVAAHAYAEWRGPEIDAAFDHGYEDARHGRSDFVRMSYRGEARTAYMRGRTAYHADRILNRVRPEPAREEIAA